MSISAPKEHINLGINKDFEWSVNFFHTCSEPPRKLTQEQLEIIKEMDRETPMDLEGLIECLDLSFLEFTLSKYYTNDYHFRFPPMAMLKAVIYFKLKGYKFLQQFHRELLISRTLADSIGFDFDKPSYNAIYHFMNYRLGVKGVKEVFKAVLREVSEYCKANGITFGKEIAIDATPVPAKPKDKETTFHPHYEVKCYLWHNVRCLDTGLPIAAHVDISKKHEGKFMIPLMMDFIEATGIVPERAYVDCGYSSFDNIVDAV